MKNKIANDDLIKKIKITIIFIIATFLILSFFPSIGKFQYVYEEGSPWKHESITAPFAFDVYKSETETKLLQDSILKNFSPCYSLEKKIEENCLNTLKKDLGSSESMKIYYKYISSSLLKIYETGVISSQNIKSGSGEILLKNNNFAKPTQISKLYTTKSAYQKIIDNIPSHLDKNTLRECNVNKYIQENILYDEQTSKMMKKELLKNISLTKGRIQSGEKIIDKGEIITKEKLDILNSLKNITLDNREEANSKSILYGQIILIISMLSIFFFYLYLFRKSYFNETKNIIFMVSISVLICFITHLIEKNGANRYLLPYAMLPFMITIFFDTRTAFFLHTITIILCSFIVTSEYEFLFLQISIGMISICSLKNLCQRSQLVWSAIIITLSYIILYCGESLIHERTLEQINWENIYIFLINGLLLLLSYPLIYIFEKLFGYISDVTLVELSNTNNDLLRKFSEDAPGSFQHSIQVSNLAAFVAQSINANPMLARTGALYHDIGKMKNAEFFTENQINRNIHDEINDEEKSAQIIINHITDGLIIAKKNNLPQKLQDFISSHHGKSKCKYFYNTYKNKYPEKEINEEKFTYPGPLPSSKEMAVVAMCDSIEAASRSLKEYTDTTISNLVDSIINSQINEGMFNDAPITLKEIEKAKKLIKEKLKTIYHTRISYPELNIQK